MADDGNGRKSNALAIGAAAAALVAGGGGIGIIGNQSTTATEIADMRTEIAELRVEMGDEEKEMIALIEATDDDAADRFRRGRLALDADINALRDKVHALELQLAREGRRNE